MRIDDDSSPKEQGSLQVIWKEQHQLNSASAAITTTNTKNLISFNNNNSDRKNHYVGVPDPVNSTSGKVLWTISTLLIITFIVSATIVLIGESRRSSKNYNNNVLSHNNVPTRQSQSQQQDFNIKTTTSATTPPTYDDDEINDAEIYNAVVQSMAEWEKISKRKYAEKLQKQQQQLLQLQLNNNNNNNNNNSQQQTADNTDLILSRQKRDEEIVCYGELGCFRDEGPFDYLDMLPSPPEEVSTKFLLYTRKNLHNPQIYSYFNFTSMSPFKNCHFNSSHSTKIIIHGFGSTCNQMWASEIRLSILTMAETNVMCVDWEQGAALPNYVRAAVNTRLVGKQVALLIFWLNKHFGSDTKDFHLIGFSLGAHVAGFAGQELKNLSRITGLDPAGPLFESYDPKVRLDSSDALFVDVIHSNGDSLLMGGLGSWEPMGHVDFYPNGGRVQKGCSNLFLGAVRDFLWAASDGDGRSLCNHRRAYKFFTESVSPKCSFPAFYCDSYDKFLTGACFSWDANRCGKMGYYADQMPVQSKGILYLLTREDEPFCANQYRITIESSPSPVPITTYGGLEAVVIGSDFINETFLITQTVKDSMVAGSILQKLIVAHPAITEPIQIQLKYTAYQGWLYSGIARWSMDSLIITNAFGKSMSFCTRLLLPNGIPVTIRLTPGICLNRYIDTPAGSGANTIGNGRPQFPLHSYDTYPAQGSDNSNANSVVQIPITENSTSAHNAAAIAADMELSMMKPPRVVIASNHHYHNNHHLHPSGGGDEVIGPSYHLTTGSANNLDWSQWHPVADPSWVSTIGSMNRNRTIGTPVELSPASDELDEEKVQDGEDESTTINPTSSVVLAEEVVMKIPSDQVEDLQIEENHLLDQEPPLSSSINATTLSPITNTTENKSNNANDSKDLSSPEKSFTNSPDLPVSIQICHFVNSDTNQGSETTGAMPTDGDSGTKPQQMSCVYPKDDQFNEQRKKLSEITISTDLGTNGDDTNGIDVMSNNALGQITSFQRMVDVEQAEQHKLAIASKSLNGTDSSTLESAKRLNTTSATVTESSNLTDSVTVKNETDNAVQNTTMKHQDLQTQESAPIPPHLHYILQQLENEGLGPGPVGPTSPSTSRSTNSNSFYRDNYAQAKSYDVEEAKRRVPPILINFNRNLHHYNRLGIPSSHFTFEENNTNNHINQPVPEQSQVVLQHHHQLLVHHQTKNPTIKHRSNSNNNKTPNPSSRALKHRPVALSTLPSSSPISGGNNGGRRSRIIDISAINLTPEGPNVISNDNHNGFSVPHHNHQYPLPSSFNSRARASEASFQHQNSNDNPTMSLLPSPGRVLSIVQDNLMLNNVPGGSSSTNSGNKNGLIPTSYVPPVPRRLHNLNQFHSRILPSGATTTFGLGNNAKNMLPGPSIASITNIPTNTKIPHHPTLFYVNGNNNKQAQKGYYLFSHAPSAFREYHHQSHQQSSTSNVAKSNNNNNGNNGVGFYKTRRRGSVSPEPDVSQTSIGSSQSQQHPHQSRLKNPNHQNQDNNSNNNPALIVPNGALTNNPNNVDETHNINRPNFLSRTL